jgi:hypothetical protein
MLEHGSYVEHKLVPMALGAGNTDVAEFRGRGGGHYKVSAA